MAVPIIDQLRRLVDIVTVDDVIDVIREENTEDMLKMSGAGEIVLLHGQSWKIHVLDCRGYLPVLLVESWPPILSATLKLNSNVWLP